MAITRGQMQRQLRKGGGIMNVASGTIGGGQYAGIPMGSRTGFGILKKIGRGIRKIIPNEIANVAVKAAPFVAPFNPALAGAMAGIGSFDQTGNIGDALKRGALTYGGGQLARGIGGAGFQGNPFASGGAFTPSGFTAGFSSPIGTQTGIGKLFKKSPEIEAISGSDFGQFKEPAFGAGDALGGEMLTKGATQTAKDVVTTTAKDASSKGVFDLIKQGNYTDAAVEAGKKALKSVFLDKDGNLDKTALLAAGSFGLSYIDAKKLADDAGVDIGTESEYDEATKAEKKEEYASYLTNFFGGKKDGGRIGFKFGDKVEDREGIISMLELIDIPDDAKDEKEIAKLAFAKKLKNFKPIQVDPLMGRVDDFLEGEGGLPLPIITNMKNIKSAAEAGKQIFSSKEKTSIIRQLAGRLRGSDAYKELGKSIPEIKKVMDDPLKYLKDAAILKEILKFKKFADGGRIGAKDGFSFMELIDDEAYNKRLQKKEDLINELMEKGYRFEDIMQLVSPRTERLMDDGTYKQYGDAPSISLGKIGFNMGGEVPVRKNKAGIEELDYRQTGGFVPVGVKEKADDVPAMLSKNEFVLTADAVRGIGGGDVEKGAEKLYGVMKQAEKVGRA
jgi:hypothetical protein